MILWRREWQSTAVFLPGEFHGQRILAGYSPWGHKESDTTERLTHTHTHTHNLNPNISTIMSNVERLYTPLETDIIDDEDALILDNIVFQATQSIKKINKDILEQ